MPNPNPIRHFSTWFRTAARRSPGTWFDPTAMTLATADKAGKVTARVVLLKKFGPEGFTFYTNYASNKGGQLSENPRAALVLYWPHLRRQVRIEGTVRPISREESRKYFEARPRLSQIAASVSKQSAVIPTRKFLTEQFKRLKKTLAGEAVPLPETWGGYRLVPDSMEFWQHRENRLHDRLRYRKEKSGKWTVERLAP